MSDEQVAAKVFEEKQYDIVINFASEKGIAFTSKHKIKINFHTAE